MRQTLNVAQTPGAHTLACIYTRAEADHGHARFGTRACSLGARSLANRIAVDLMSWPAPSLKRVECMTLSSWGVWQVHMSGIHVPLESSFSTSDNKIHLEDIMYRTSPATTPQHRQTNTSPTKSSPLIHDAPCTIPSSPDRSSPVLFG